MMISYLSNIELSLILISENLFFIKYLDLFSFKRRWCMTKSEMYEAAVAKSVKMFQIRKEQNWSEEEFEVAVR